MKTVRASEQGFTLLELTAALTLLGFAFATLIGLQTRLLDTFTQERNLFRAALAAQYLMTFMEIEDDPPDTGSQEGDLVDALREKGYFEDMEEENLEESLRGWKSKLVVTSVDYPGIQEDILRRIDLSIYWGESERQHYTLVHFMKTKLTQNSLGGN